MWEHCKNYVEDCYDGAGKPCQFLDWEGDHWCHKNLIEFYLEKVFNNLKNRPKTDESITFIVGNPEEYVIDKVALEKLGYKVDLQEREHDFDMFMEQMRRADVLADYVYTEKVGFNLPIKEEKDINAAGSMTTLYSDCRNLGLLNYLNFAQISLYKKIIVVYGGNADLIDKLLASGAVVIASEDYVDVNWRFVDLIINFNSKINCYPIHCPVVDIANECINIENREVIQDAHLLNILGILEQLW